MNNINVKIAFFLTTSGFAGCKQIKIRRFD